MALVSINHATHIHNRMLTIIISEVQLGLSPIQGHANVLPVSSVCCTRIELSPSPALVEANTMIL